MKTNTIVIGAGQAGLSVSYCLKKLGIEHLVLERGKIANGWRENRWDSFRLITPNYMTQLPGFAYKGKSPKGFDSRDQMIKFFEEYVKKFALPILENVEVKKIGKIHDGFEVKTGNETYVAKNVIIAIGSFHKPRIPTISKLLPRTIKQLHSSEYKNADLLPKGTILVVGGGNSGVQIANDLNKSGRKVYLSLGRLRIVPRDYRGKDFMEWAKILGALDKTAEEATPEVKAVLPPLLFGNKQTVNFRKLGKDGIQLVGHLKKVERGKFIFAQDLKENLEKGETALAGFKSVVDKMIADKKLKAPKATSEKLVRFEPKDVRQLDIKDVGIVIWATGFDDDYDFLKVRAFDKKGEPVHKKGVSKIPGLYFIGLRWLSKYKSFLLSGVAEDAEYITKQIKAN